MNQPLLLACCCAQRGSHTSQTLAEEDKQEEHWGWINESGRGNLFDSKLAKEGWKGFSQKGHEHEFIDFLATAVKHPTRSHVWLRWRNVRLIAY
jgi:hypothetical protein